MSEFMRLPNKIILCAALCACSLTAGEWKLDGEGFAFDSTQARARAVGPIRFEWGGWVIHASTEAQVSSAAKILKRPAGNDGSRYGVDSEPAKIVFLGNCRVVDKRGVDILKGTYLILDLGARTVTSTGSGLLVRVDEKVRASGTEEAQAVVNLISGSVTLSEAGWKDGVLADKAAKIAR